MRPFYPSKPRKLSITNCMLLSVSVRDRSTLFVYLRFPAAYVCVKISVKKVHLITDTLSLTYSQAQMRKHEDMLQTSALAYGPRVSSNRIPSQKARKSRSLYDKADVQPLKKLSNKIG